MSFKFDLSWISCPKCETTENIMLEVIGKHEFPGSNVIRSPLYDILCRKCNLVFRRKGFLSIC